MKPTQEQVIAWARGCGDWNGQTAEMNDVGLERFAALAYEAGRNTVREWQGLTDEEIKSMEHVLDWTAYWSTKKFAYAIEAKLKAKNA